MKYPPILFRSIVLAFFVVTAVLPAQSWYPVNVEKSKYFANIRDFVLVDTNTIYGLAKMSVTGPQLLKSTDNGENWKIVYQMKLDTTPYLTANPNMIGCITNKNTIIFSCNYGYILRSDDGGKSFERIRVDTTLTGTENFVSVYFDSTTTSGIIVAPRKVYSTSDGGRHWKSKPLVAPDTAANTIFRAVIRSIDTIYAHLSSRFGETQIFANSYDGGDTWTKSEYKIQHSLNMMTYVDSKNGWYIAGVKLSATSDSTREYIYHTSDAGLTWETQLDSLVSDSITQTPPNGISYINFYDRRNGLAVGNNKILRTWDGGKSWHIQDCGARFVAFVPTGVRFISDSIAFIGNFRESPNIIKWDANGKTVDVERQENDDPAVKADVSGILVSYDGDVQRIVASSITDSDVTAVLYNLTGAVAAKAIGSGSIAIPTGQLSKGVYVVYVKDALNNQKVSVVCVN
ncbi:MAG: hypothetical protein RL156_760 [Bacteroidota bacterium]